MPFPLVVHHAGREHPHLVCILLVYEGVVGQVHALSIGCQRRMSRQQVIGVVSNAGIDALELKWAVPAPRLLRSSPFYSVLLLYSQVRIPDEIFLTAVIRVLAP